jgi:hypothetical protein
MFYHGTCEANDYDEAINCLSDYFDVVRTTSNDVYVELLLCIWEVQDSNLPHVVIVYPDWGDRLIAGLAYSSTLKMETVRSSETSVNLY